MLIKSVLKDKFSPQMYTGVNCDCNYGHRFTSRLTRVQCGHPAFSPGLCLASELTTTQTSVCRGKECMGIHIKSPKKMTDTYEFAH